MEQGISSNSPSVLNSPSVGPQIVFQFHDLAAAEFVQIHTVRTELRPVFLGGMGEQGHHRPI